MSLGAIRFASQEIRSLASGSIGAAYMGIGSVVDVPTRIMYIVNATDQLLMFSDDGITDKWVIPASTSLIVDITANGHIQGLFSGEGRRIYVKQVSAPPSTGSVYLTVWYAIN